MAFIFDGNELATQLRLELKDKVGAWSKKHPDQPKIRITALVFTQDQGGQLYTRKKAEAAAQVGIDYVPHFYSINDPLSLIKKQIKALNNDGLTTGIIIQKPQRKVYEQSVVGEKSLEFAEWWQELVGCLTKEKDVDGLSPTTLQAIKKGNWQKEKRVLPATVVAVLKVIEEAHRETPAVFKDKKPLMVIVGKSDLLGTPLTEVARHFNYQVENWGKKEFLAVQELTGVAGPTLLQKAKVIVSATGQAGLIKGKVIGNDQVLIDVGEPEADIDFESCKTKAAFITPVPGGVGPLTVVSLLENCFELAQTYPWVHKFER